MREIYIKGGTVRELAVVEDGRLCEYILDDTSAATTEAVYLGRVVRVVPGMKAAFVDIGQEKNGFLPLAENSKSCVVPKLMDGMHVLVQVKKTAQGTKGAFLTRDITLCGATVLLMPMNRYVGVSARVTDDGDREVLKALGQSLCGGEYGVVMRQAALDADEETIREELDGLLAVWAKISAQAPTAHAPSLIHRPRTQLDMLLDDDRARGIDRIVTDDLQLAEMLSAYPVTIAGADLMEAAGLIRQRDKALGRYVWLDCGGNLVIDRCEAMTVIDVNTAKNTGRRDLEATVLKTNLEACGEIARQVRLRNASGIILIDMIDMATEEARQQVLEALENAFRADRIKTVIHGFTSLGLVEMTRKKSRAPLCDDWTTPCTACQGTGRAAKEKEEHHG